MITKLPSQFKLAKNNFAYKEGLYDKLLSSANAYVENHRISVLYSGNRFRVVSDNKFGNSFTVTNMEESESFLYSVFGKTYTVIRNPGNIFKMYGMLKYNGKECINEADVVTIHARPGRVGSGPRGKLCNCPQFTQNWMEHVYANHNYKIGRRHF